MKPDPKGYTWYKTPKFPDVPYQEYRDRLKRAQDLMVKNGIDCLALWERENIRYFFGFQSNHWWIKSLQNAVGIIPVKGEPTIVVPYLFKGNAEVLCWTRDIRWQPDAHQPRAQRELPREVAGLVKEMGYEKKTIALESGPLGCMYIPRPLNDIDNFRKSLPDAKFVDGDEVIWGCRMIKSSLEMERIRKSLAGLADVQLAIVEGFRPGMNEEDLLAVFNQKRVQLKMTYGDDPVGAEHFIAGKDKSMCADISALEGVVITKGDTIQWDGTLPYKGYVPDSARMWQVGPITADVRKAYDTIFEAEDASEDMLKPGVKANEVYEAMYKIVRDAGYAPIDMGGHGSGLDWHEPPSVDAWNTRTVEEGMVFSLEPWLMTKEGVIFGIQDTFIVTNKGCEKVEALRRDIIQVSHPIQ